MRKIYALASLLALVSIALAARSFAEDQKELGVSIGAKAPDFTLQDQNGKPVSLHDFAGKIVVLEWTNPQCPFVQRHYHQKTMQTLASQFESKNVSWLAINSTSSATNDSNKQWAEAQSISYPILNDSNGTVGKEYHATNTPDMYVIGTDGTLLYQGAIDNDKAGDMTTGKVNYVHQALEEILSGKAVSTPQTKPYGCGVKYKD
ncbi:MAG TPA: redoxin domain-containing protein [Tepidisphaeraceae bacterium]|jgi:peroxiredoxin|nr:redoxin domain-containing protein [Tepidisphaeraceae bacterium]